MKNSLVLTLFVLASALVSCREHSTPEPKYDSLVGSWKLEKNEVVITFDIIADPSGAFGKYHTTNEYVKYVGKTSDAHNNVPHSITTANGFYTIDFFTTANNFANRTHLYACEPSADYKTLTAKAGLSSKPDESSYVSLVGFINTDNLVIYWRDPIVISRTK